MASTRREFTARSPTAIAHRIMFARSTVRDHGDTVDAQEWRAHVRVVVEATAELPDARQREQTRDLAERSAEDVAADPGLQHVERAFEALREHVAVEAVGEADVGGPPQHIA